VHFPDHGTIQVHQQRIQLCPFQFPAGYYWYGAKSVGPGHPPKWVERMLGLYEPSHYMRDIADPSSMESSDNTDAIVVNADTPIVTAQDNMSDLVSVDDDNEMQQQAHKDEDGVQQHAIDQTTSQGILQITRTRTIVPPQRYRTYNT